jgi:hypothetical protein
VLRFSSSLIRSRTRRRSRSLRFKCRAQVLSAPASPGAPCCRFQLSGEPTGVGADFQASDRRSEQFPVKTSKLVGSAFPVGGYPPPWSRIRGRRAVDTGSQRSPYPELAAMSLACVRGEIPSLSMPRSLAHSGQSPARPGNRPVSVHENDRRPEAHASHFIWTPQNVRRLYSGRAPTARRAGAQAARNEQATVAAPSRPAPASRFPRKRLQILPGSRRRTGSRPGRRRRERPRRPDDAV